MLEISNTDSSNSRLERWDLFIVINEETKQSKTGQWQPCPLRHIKLCDVVVLIGYSRLVQITLFYQIRLSWDHAWIKLCWALTFIQVQKAPHKLFLTWHFPPPGLDYWHDPWLQITDTDWWVQRTFGLLTPLFHAWILWFFCSLLWHVRTHLSAQ